MADAPVTKGVITLDTGKRLLLQAQSLGVSIGEAGGFLPPVRR
jgi:hypothetical protein